MKRIALLLAVVFCFAACEKNAPTRIEGSFTATFSSSKLQNYDSEPIFWEAGDKVVLSNCSQKITFENGEVSASENAESFTVTPEMISADGKTITFSPTISGYEKFVILAAKDFDGIASIGKDGTVEVEKQEAATELNYFASAISPDGTFKMCGLNNYFCVNISDKRIKYFDVSAGYSSFELELSKVPVKYYFPIPTDEDLSDGIYAYAYDKSCDKLYDEHYSDLTFGSNQVVSLGYFIDYGGADARIINEILKSDAEVEATYNLEGEILKKYLDEVEYDNDYSYTKIKNYVPKSMESSSCRPAYVSVKGLTSPKKVYLVSEDFDIQVRSISSTDKQAVYSLIPGRQYKYGVVTTDSKTGEETIIKTGCIKTEGRVRVIKTKVMHNVRDMGGWEGLDGKHIKYGILIRGGEVIDKNDKLDKYDPYDYEAMMNHAKVDFDMDFRTDEGAAYVYKSPLGIEFIRIPLSAYDSIVEKKDRQVAFKKAILKFISNTRDGKCTYVHCQGGADRTGTFVFYLEGLLGVSDSDLCKDYEITSFYYHKERNDSERYLPMIKALQKKYGTDITIGEAIYKSALSMGITEQNIQELRDLLLE